MATKTPAPAKKTVAAKKAAPAKTVAKKKASKGQSLECEVCGAAVMVEEVGGIVVGEESTLLCCDMPMKKKAVKAKTAAAPVAKAPVAKAKAAKK
jgi:hypothetical protein